MAYAAQGVGECFEPGRTGWVIPADDRAAFRAALAPLLAEPRAARAARGEAARQFARARFDPDRQVRAYLELFARLAP